MTHIPVNSLWSDRRADIDQIRSGKETVELTFWPHGYRMPKTGLALLALHWPSIPSDRGGVEMVVKRVPTLLDIEAVKALRAECDGVIKQMEAYGRRGWDDEGED